MYLAAAGQAAGPGTAGALLMPPVPICGATGAGAGRRGRLRAHPAGLVLARQRRIATGSGQRCSRLSGRCAPGAMSVRKRWHRRRSLTSSALALVVAALAVALALPAARALALHAFRGKRLVLFALLLPMLAPPLAAAMGLHAVFLRAGLADSFLGVALVHLIPAVPYATFVLAGTFSGFDPDWEAQARTLGASPGRCGRASRCPAIAPGVALAAILAFVVSWSQYVLTLLVGGGRVLTVPLAAGRIPARRRRGGRRGPVDRLRRSDARAVRAHGAAARGCVMGSPPLPADRCCPRPLPLRAAPPGTPDIVSGRPISPA